MPLHTGNARRAEKKGRTERGNDMDYKGRYVDHRALAGKCRARVDVYNMAGADWLAKHELDCASAINDLISRLEAAEARCAALDEARENANEACAKWEGMYRMALERAEKAERERDAAVQQLHGLCSACKYYTPYHNDGLCATCTHEVACFVPEKATDKWEWVGVKEE